MKENPDYGDCMPLDEFLEGVISGCFIDYDGWGYPSDGTFYNHDNLVRPSDLESIPEGTTHILWFNR